LSNAVLSPSLADLPHVLSIAELAKILRLSRTTAYDHARRGLLPVPVIRSGRRLMVSKSALLKVLGVEADR